MWKTIKKGRHDSSFLPEGIHFGKTSQSYEVQFDESCRYNLQGIDQLDWNKLVGWSYGLHHNNSIRIGWRYNKEIDKIELVLYCYINNKRIIHEDRIHLLNLGEKVVIELEVIKERSIWFAINDKLILAWTPLVDINIKWGYKLGVYFGGTSPAPHNMRVYIKEL